MWVCCSQQWSGRMPPIFVAQLNSWQTWSSILQTRKIRRWKSLVALWFIAMKDVLWEICFVWLAYLILKTAKNRKMMTEQTANETLISYRWLQSMLKDYLGGSIMIMCYVTWLLQCRSFWWINSKITQPHYSPDLTPNNFWLFNSRYGSQ